MFAKSCCRTRCRIASWFGRRFAYVCEELLCCGDSCSLLYLLLELTYCCMDVGVDCDRVRGHCLDEEVAVVTSENAHFKWIVKPCMCNDEAAQPKS